ncbi:MAG: VOC family protein [Candidatus Hydrothermales bacterium]
MKVNHISVAVKDFDRATKIFEKIFELEPEIHYFEERKLKIAIFHLENLMFEIISPLEGEETVSKFLEKRGDGIHHIALEVEDVEEKIKYFKENGFNIVEDIRKGIKSKKVFFLDPRDTGRVLIEVVEGEYQQKDK